MTDDIMSAKHQDLFSDKSDLYASAQPTYPDELYQYIASLCYHKDVVWVCATGNGQAAIGLARYFAQVQASDISRQQIHNVILDLKIIYSIQPAESTRFAKDQVDPEVDSVIKKTVLDVINPYWAKQTQLLWEGYQNVPFPFTRLRTPQFELSLKWNCDQLIAYMHTWSATRRCIEGQSDEFFLLACATIRQAWGKSTDNKRVLMRLHLLLGRG